MLHAERTVGMQGVVEVDWTITGGPNVTKEFMNSSGTAIFEDVSKVLYLGDMKPQVFHLL